MASGSGKNQDDIQEPVHARCEESIAAAAAAAVPAAEPPPHAPPFACVKVQAHGRPGVGGEGPSAAAAAAGEEEDDEASAAAAAAERKGQRAAYPSPTPSPSSCEGRGPPIIIPVVPVTGAGESSSVATVGSVGRAGVSRRELLVDDVPEMPGLQNVKAARDLDKRWAEKEALKQLIAQGDICSGETSNQQIAQGDICSGEASNQQIAQAESLNLQVAKGERSTVHSLGQHISTGIPQIPEEIQWLILLRLRPKDILRCQCVCLLWRRIGDSARFRSDHARHWSSTIPIFFHLPGFPWDHNLDLTATSIDLHGIDLAFRKSRSILHFPDILGHTLDSDDSRSLHAQGCCSGIILLSYKDDLCACCPYSGNWRSLPPIHIKNVIMAFYTRAGVSTRDDDEFLLLYRTDEPPPNPHSFSIYSLGQDSTREIYCPKVLGSLTVLDKMLQQHPPVIQERAVSVGGMIYWLLHLEAPSGKNHLLAFSKDNEEFWLMSPPDLSGIYSHQLLQVKGQLALSVFNEGMTELGLWLHLGGPEEPWFHWKRISLPMDEIDANHGLERFGEPIVHIVSEELEFLADCPHILLQGNSEGGIVQQHGHTQHWCMTLPQSLEARLDVPAFLDKKSTPPFFRFVDT